MRYEINNWINEKLRFYDQTVELCDSEIRRLSRDGTGGSDSAKAYCQNLRANLMGKSELLQELLAYAESIDD